MGLARIVVVLLLATGLASCTREKTCVQQLAGTGFKYWMVVLPVDSSRTARTLYYFDDSGRWLPFTLFANGTVESAMPDDVEVPHQWRSTGDSLWISTDRFTVQCHADTMVLVSSKGTRTLWPIALEQVPPDYRRRQ